MSRTIVVDFDLPSPPAQVWRTLTEPALVARWLMETDIAPIVGRQFSFRGTPMGDWDGHVACEVLAVEPARLLRYSWRGGSGANRLDTIVTWTLTPTSTGGTLLHLEHAGFADANGSAFDAFTIMGGGWRGKGDEIAALATALVSSPSA